MGLELGALTGFVRRVSKGFVDFWIRFLCGAVGLDKLDKGVPKAVVTIISLGPTGSLLYYRRTGTTRGSKMMLGDTLLL